MFPGFGALCIFLMTGELPGEHFLHDAQGGGLRFFADNPQFLEQMVGSPHPHVKN
jgi:hypothetical protein